MSYWPEANTLRGLVKPDLIDPPHTFAAGQPRGFPRADLGLPIIFHFKDAAPGFEDGFTLEGPADGQRRFASPVITRAMPDGGHYRAMVAVLNAPPVWDAGPIWLNGCGRSGRIGQAGVEVLAARPRISPLNPRGAPLDTRSALLEFVAREWRTTVRALP